MTSSPMFWALLTLFFIMTEGFYSSMEMAIVSFNKVRLQYYVSKGQQRASWLKWLLQHPTRLFGTTLLGVNIAMQIGSECSRHLYTALDLHPDLAPLTQVILVLVFAELAPIFAARRSPEHLSMLGVPLIYASAKVMTPMIWVITGVTRWANRIAGGQEVDTRLFLSHDELLTIMHDQDEEAPGESSREMSEIARNIFSLNSKVAADVMEPIGKALSVPNNCTVGRLREILHGTAVAFLPVFHRSPSHVVGIALVRDYVGIEDEERVDAYMRSPWFITQNGTLGEILHQFRRNNQSVAVVLNEPGRAIGVITLEGVLDEVFGKITPMSADRLPQTVLALDKTYPGDTRISKFNKDLGVTLQSEGAITLAQLVEKELGHHPKKGESVQVGQFRLEVVEVTLLEVRKVRVHTRTR